MHLLPCNLGDRHFGKLHQKTERKGSLQSSHHLWRICPESCIWKLPKMAKWQETPRGTKTQEAGRRDVKRGGDKRSFTVRQGEQQVHGSAREFGQVRVHVAFSRLHRLPTSPCLICKNNPEFLLKGPQQESCYSCKAPQESQHTLGCLYQYKVDSLLSPCPPLDPFPNTL